MCIKHPVHYLPITGAQLWQCLVIISEHPKTLGAGLDVVTSITIYPTFESRSQALNGRVSGSQPWLIPQSPKSLLSKDTFLTLF